MSLLERFPAMETLFRRRRCGRARTAGKGAGWKSARAAVAVGAVVGCGLTLAGCESLSNLQLPSFGLGGGGPTPVTLNLESDPAGADVTLSTGGTCRTPCALPVAAAGDVVATFVLPNYQTRSITARAVPAEKNMIGMESNAARFEPNPVYAELQPVPPKKQRRRPADKPTQAAAKKPAAPRGAPSAAAPAPPPPAIPAPATPAPPQQ